MQCIRKKNWKSYTRVSFSSLIYLMMVEELETIKFSNAKQSMIHTYIHTHTCILTQFRNYNQGYEISSRFCGNLRCKNPASAPLSGAFSKWRWLGGGRHERDQKMRSIVALYFLNPPQLQRSALSPLGPPKYSHRAPKNVDNGVVANVRDEKISSHFSYSRFICASIATN